MTSKQKSTPLVAIHLSDIHFGQERGVADNINKDARDQLIRKVREIAAERAEAGRPPIGSIVITGDVAYSGKKGQYDTAVAWLAKVSEAAGCNPQAVQVVPGNHDVERGTSPMVIGLIKELFRLGMSHLDKVLASEFDRNALYDRMKAYQAFANGYGCPLDTKGGHAGVKEHVLAPGRKLRLVGLNSALMCCGKENNRKPKLLLGQQMIIDELDDVENIVLVHHPMSWLRDGDKAQDYIDNRARILMCGHEHKPNVTLRDVEGNDQVLVIDAGATVPDQITPQYTYTFNVIEIDLADVDEAVDVTVDTYKWKQSALRFHQDTTSHENGAPKCYPLRCPQFVAAGVRERSGTTVTARAPEPAEPGEAASESTPATPVEAIDLAPSGTATDADVLYAKVRGDFFHSLSIPQRISVLVRLKALPEGIESLGSNLMLQQLERLNSRGKTAELAAAIAEAYKA